MRTNRVKELEVPIHVMAVVSEIIAENQLVHRLAGGDDEEELVFVDVEYDRTNEKHQEAMKEIEGYIGKFEEYEERGPRKAQRINEEENK